MNILNVNKVRINSTVTTKEDAVRLAGQLLVDAGHVPAQYIEFMLEREQKNSTYMGEGLAIPHGTNEAKPLVRTTGISVVVIPNGVEFGDDERAQLVIGIAAVGDDHLELLTNIAVMVSDPDQKEAIVRCSSPDELVALFEKGLAA